jgi:TonB family protein
MRTLHFAALLAILAATPHLAFAQSSSPAAAADSVPTIEGEQLTKKLRVLNPEEIQLRIARSRPRPEDFAAPRTTTLLLVIGEDGAVRSAEVAGSSGNPRVDRVMVNAWRGVRFTPPRLDGRPVRVRMRLPVSLGYEPASPPAAANVTPH